MAITLNTAKILVPIDFSNHSHRALEYAKALAKPLEGTLHIIHVVQEIERTEEWGYIYTNIKDAGEAVKKAIMEKLEAVAEEVKADGIATHIAVLHGHPDIQIELYAEHHGIDFIVIGTQGKRGVERFVLGSTTERVLRKGKVPVFSVPLPREKREE